VAGPDEAGIPPGGLVFDRGAVPGAGGLDRWLAVVRAAEEPCLLIDRAWRVRAPSPAALRLLARTTDPVGRPLVPELLDLVDVAALLGTTGNLAPIAAARSGIQARSLARCRRGDGSVVTVDIIAAPLRHGGQPVGAIAFLDQVYPVPRRAGSHP
jgi:hypothetical protein